MPLRTQGALLAHTKSITEIYDTDAEPIMILGAKELMRHTPGDFANICLLLLDSTHAGRRSIYMYCHITCVYRLRPTRHALLAPVPFPPPLECGMSN